MRRVLSLIPLVALLAVAALALPGQAREAAPAVQVTLPGTNTPRPMPFATNTPAGPTATATASVTPSATPTATSTASDTPTQTSTATDTPSPTPTPNGPFIYPQGVNALTGLPFPNEEAQARRNMLVKISNYPPIVRPQSGLNAADVVFEYEVEGGVTRFAAIFRNNNPTHVGPVRSGRLVDLELVPMYEALFAYSGSSEPIREIVLDVPWGYQVLSPQFGDNCEEAGFCRFPDGDLAFEHTLYLDTNIAWARATRRNVNTGYPARGFAFADQPPDGGRPATDIFIDWYGQTDVRWQYSDETGRYVRYTDGVPHFDRADGEQLWTDNVVIVEAPHVERTDLFEPESRSASQEIQLWDEGRAYLFRDGVYYEGYWRRKDREPGSALQLIFPSGASMFMKPGRSYVQIVRWLGDVVPSETQADMVGTSTQIALSATPTRTPTPEMTSAPATP
jgi:hypothetical protein